MAAWQLLAATGRELTRFGKVPLYPEGLYDLGNRVYAWMVPNGSWGESNAGLNEAIEAALGAVVPRVRAMIAEALTTGPARLRRPARP